MPVGKIILLSVLILFAQVLIGAPAQRVGSEFNLILLYVIFLSCRQDVAVGMSVGFLLGLSESVLRMQSFGLRALAYVLTGYLPRVLGNVLFLENMVARYIYLVLAHLIMLILEGTVEPALGHSLPAGGVFFTHRLYSFGLDCLALPLIFWMLATFLGTSSQNGSRTHLGRAKSKRR